MPYALVIIFIKTIIYLRCLFPDFFIAIGKKLDARRSDLLYTHSYWLCNRAYRGAVHLALLSRCSHRKKEDTSPGMADCFKHPVSFHFIILYSVN